MERRVPIQAPRSRPTSARLRRPRPPGEPRDGRDGALPANIDPQLAPLGAALLEHVQRTAGNAAAALLVFQREDDTTGADGADDDAANAPADPAAAHPTLREGSHGPAVQEMQDKLGQALTAGGPVTTDGRFGPTTSRRVRQFQRARGLAPDGVVGPATWTALEAAAAGVPAPVRPTLSLGATGADVGLAQEKLNASGQAGATLPINAVFDAPMQTAVNAFQSTNGLTPPSGAVDVATWAALDSAAPGGGTRLEGGRSVEQHVDAASPATSTAAQVPGTSLHSLVGPGGITSGPAVREFQQKLNAWLAGQGQAAISDDGSWGPNTGAAATAFQGVSGVAATGVGDLPTWTALDAVAPNASVGFENRQWTEQVGGHTYGMTDGAGSNGSRYSWEIAGTQMKVTAAVQFVGGSPPGAWFGYVRDTWNHFDLVEQATGQRLPINFEMTRGAGAGANTVKVSRGTGRANGGEWFLADTDAANTIPHEFGHLVGLRDEYQQSPGDYRAATGHEPFVGDAAGPGGQTPAQIATALQAAMVARSSANAVAAVAGMRQGAFSQQVVQAYAALATTTVPAVAGPPALAPVPLTGNLARDLDAALPDDSATTSDKYDTIEALTYDSGSIMGDPSRHRDPHDHGAQPRHLQEFADILGRTQGGTWVPTLR